MHSVREWIEWVARQFERSDLHYGHGTDNSRDEAYWLVLHAIDAPLQEPFLDWNSVPGEAEAARIRKLTDARISQRCPLAYLTGTAWFAGLEFEVSPDVLVPRSPLAEGIGNGFSPWVQADEIRSILDIGTGSGCIAIACALRFPDARVEASDISESALKIAVRNIRKHNLTNRVRAVRSDLFESLEGRRYDLIVSNPPYVPERNLAELPHEFSVEPRLGLVSAMDGLQIPLRILQAAHAHLNPGGVLICEVGESQQRLQRALSQVPFVWLEFESGGEGVFLLEYHQLDAAGKLAGELLRDQ